MYLSTQSSFFINIFLISLLLYYILSGYRKGFLLQLIDLLGLIAAFLVAWILAAPLGNQIKLLPESLTPFLGTPLEEVMYKQVNIVAWFLLLFAVACILVVAFKFIAKSVQHIPIIASVNKIFGVLFAIVRLFIVAFIIIFVLSTPFFKNGAEIIDNSFLKQFREYGMQALSFIEEPLNEFILIQKFSLNPDSLSAEEKNDIVAWLMEQGLTQEAINKFFNGYNEGEDIEPNEP